MKMLNNLSLISCALAGSMILFLGSCQDDDFDFQEDEDEPAELRVNHSFGERDTIYGEPGDEFDFSYTVDPKTAIDEITITRSFNLTPTFHAEEFSISETFFERDFDLPANEFEDEFTIRIDSVFDHPSLTNPREVVDGAFFRYSFEIEDASDVTTSFDFLVFAGSRLNPYTPNPKHTEITQYPIFPRGFAEERPDPFNYAYDLSNDEDLVEAIDFETGQDTMAIDSNVHLMDTATTSPANRAIYGPGEANNTRFVNAEGMSVDFATNIELFHTYQRRPKRDIIEDPREGTSFILRLDGSEALDDHMLINIEDRFPVDDCGDFGEECDGWAFQIYSTRYPER